MTRPSASRMTFSSAMAAQAAADLDDDDDEPGEVIESAPPLRVGEERLITTTSSSAAAVAIKKKLIREGRGWLTPVFGDETTVHYVSTLPDGTQLDSTRGRGEPRTFNLGCGELANGLDDGIATMTKGEVALFTVPAVLSKGGRVPDGVDVLFEVELVSWLTVVDITKDGGVVKKILVAGDDVHTGDLDEVHVKYQVKLLDGSKVAESPEEGLWFHVNEGHLFPAYSKAVKTMRRGEKAVLTVQPQYAFGESGRVTDNGFPAIPPNVALVIDTELLSLRPVLDVTGDMKVLKKILRAGEGIRRPTDGETVCVRYTAMLENGMVFESIGFEEQLFEFVIDEEQVIAGLDQAVATMLKGEFARITVKPEYGFENDLVQRAGVTVPPHSTLVYEVELVDFKKEKEVREMSNIEKIEAAEKAKESGNELYKIGKFLRAVKKYDKAVNFIIDDGTFESDEEKHIKTLRVLCWLNQAACNLKLKDFQETIKSCSLVLDTESCNVKALYRRAQAYMATGDLDLAKLDLQKALEVDPQNREVKSLLVSVRQQQLESNKRDAKLYSNMFDRMKKDTDTALKRLKVERVQDEDIENKEPQAMEAENNAMGNVQTPM